MRTPEHWCLEAGSSNALSRKRLSRDSLNIVCIRCLCSDWGVVQRRGTGSFVRIKHILSVQPTICELMLKICTFVTCKLHRFHFYLSAQALAKDEICKGNWPTTCLMLGLHMNLSTEQYSTRSGRRTLQIPFLRSSCSNLHIPTRIMSHRTVWEFMYIKDYAYFLWNKRLCN